MRKTLAFILIATLALLVAACGNDPTPTAAPPEPEPTTAPAATETPAQPAEPAEEATAVSPSATIDDIVNIVWLWEEYQDTAGQNNINVPDPSRYSVTFLPDGSLQIQADCNQAGGTYTPDGSSLAIQIGFSTRAFCGEESLDQVFLQRLGETATFVLEGNQLFLNMMADAGNLVFANGGQAEGAEGSTLDISPDDIRLDTQGLPYSWQANLVAGTPYDESMPPGPMGLPEHIQVNMGVTDPADRTFLDPVIYIIPVEAYEQLWGDAGNDYITNVMLQIYRDSIVLPNPPPTSDMPVLPPEGHVAGTNDLAVQVSAVPSTEQSATKDGFRFVGRFMMDANEVTNQGLQYIYQGFTNDGEYLVSAFFPVSTAALPNDPSMSAEELNEVMASAETFEAYMQEQAATLNALAPSNWSPDLATLDAVIASLEIATLPPHGLEGRVWQWDGRIIDPNTGVLSQDPVNAIYTVTFREDGTFSFQADCNNGAGQYDVSGGIAGAIALTPGPVTLAECGPDSRYDEFVNLLTVAQNFRVRAGGSEMDLIVPGVGDFVFTNLGPADEAEGDAQIPPAVLPTPEPQEPTGTVTAPEGVNVRTGPGFNYPVLAVAPFGTTGEIVGRSADGEWWVIDAPTAPNGQVWVSASFVEATNVQNVPVIAPPPPPIITPTPAPTATPGPTISFAANPTSIDQGNCSTLSWSVENIQAVWVYPQGQPYNQFPVEGQGSQQVCPARTTTYEMRVLRTDGVVELYSVTVSVRSSNPLVGTSWRLVSLQPGQSLVPTNNAITLVFGTNGQVSGSGGCNSFNGPYSVNNINLSIGPLTSGQVACDAPIMDQERAYFQALQSARTYTFNINQLIMRDGNGAEVAKFSYTGN